jgi:hypothetical protein
MTSATGSDISNDIDGNESEARRRVFLAVAWRQWIACREMVLGFLAAWIICIWVLQLFNHPVWVALFGGVFALCIGPVMGGADAAEGSEDFALTLPCHRHEHYLARLAFGGTWLGLFIIGGCLAIAFEWPQMLWGLFVQSGMTQRNPRIPADALRGAYAFPVVVPGVLYVTSFGLAAINQTGRWLSLSSAAALALVSLTWLLTAEISKTIVGGVNFEILFGPLLLIGGAVLALSYSVYRRKESADPARAFGRRPSTLLTVILSVLLLYVFLALANAQEQSLFNWSAGS